MKGLIFVLALVSGSVASADALVCKVQGFIIALETPPRDPGINPDFERTYNIQNPNECDSIAQSVMSSLISSCGPDGQYVFVNYSVLNPSGNAIRGGSYRSSCR